MLVRQLRLQDFRLHRSLELQLQESGAILVGRNGTGKSSILEAIHCVSVTRSFRRVPDEQLIRKGAPHLEVVADLAWEGEPHSLEYRVAVGTGKRIYLDGRILSRLAELVESTSVVTTSSEDILIVEGSPSYARRWLSLFASQQERGHLATLQRYQHVLRQRNALLARAKDDPAALSPGELDTWTEQLIELAFEIETKRTTVVRAIAERVPNFYARVAGEERTVQLEYRPGLDPNLDVNAIRRMRNREIVRGHTLWGPHRGGLETTLDGLPTRYYASRGEKRSLAFALKMSQAELLPRQPVCLVDDLSLELDPARSREVLLQFMELGQVVASSARPEQEWPGDLDVVVLENERS
jgi:DNA replication and repair protein RecF